MMQSVALTDSVQQDEEYILVQAAVASHDESDFDDEGSYDYCDDAYSLLSAPQTMVVDTQALQQGFQDDFFEPPPSTTLMNENENATTMDDMQILLQGISSSILEEQEDAQIPELESPENLVTQGDDIRPKLQSASAIGVLRSSIDHLPVSELCEQLLFKPESMSTRFQEPSTGSSIRQQEHPSSSSSSSSSEDDTTDPSEEDDETSGASSPRSTSPGQPKSGAGRITNKKRRKQMKLAKKAAAAAAAAAALSTLTLSSRSPARSRKIRQVTAKKPSKKQVANIAVACATEAFDSYREELKKNKKM